MGRVRMPPASSFNFPQRWGSGAKGASPRVRAARIRAQSGIRSIRAFARSTDSPLDRAPPQIGAQDLRMAALSCQVPAGGAGADLRPGLVPDLDRPCSPMPAMSARRARSNACASLSKATTKSCGTTSRSGGASVSDHIGRAKAQPAGRDISVTRKPTTTLAEPQAASAAAPGAWVVPSAVMTTRFRAAITALSAAATVSFSTAAPPTRMPSRSSCT